MFRKGGRHLRSGAYRLLLAAMATPAWAAPSDTGELRDEAVVEPVFSVPPAVAAGSAAVRQDAPRLNSSGRAMRIVAPLTEGSTYLGDVELEIGADDSIQVAGWQVVELLARVIDPAAVETLASVSEQGAFVPIARFGELGVPLSFDPRLLELRIEVPVSMRARQTIGLASLDQDIYGEFAQPEAFSAYMNFRLASDYVHVGSNDGFADPTVLMDGAARMGSFVLENEMSLAGGRDLTRDGTRVVYDDVERLHRWVGGDLLPQSRGFQGVREMAGLSVERVYGLMDPQRNVAPRGGRSFTLDREATVEALVNGRVIRTLRLQPGTYDVSDFPFVQGSNDVDLVITDDTGRQELLSFSVFVDRTQLAPGLSEYGFYLGVASDAVAGSIEYTGDPVASGFYRRGVSDNVTAGANFQYLESGWLVGAEGVWGSSWGTIGGDVAFSDLDLVGGGWAVNVSYERLVQDAGGGAAFQASLEARSRRFGAPTQLSPDNRYAFNAAVAYSRSFGESSFAGGRFAIGRPITDGFVIAAPYAGARGTTIEVEPSPDGFYARSGPLGPALYGQVGSYSPRTVTYDAPDAQGGFDIGTGALRVLAPYRAGYVITVGSDYNVTVIGRLLDRLGEPVTFLSGEAIEVGGDGRRVEVFTNRQGVFGASGLKPGRWRIELLGEPPRVYELVVPETQDGLARVGDLRPVG